MERAGQTTRTSNTGDCADALRSLQVQLRPESGNESAPSSSTHIGIVLNHRLAALGVLPQAFTQRSRKIDRAHRYFPMMGLSASEFVFIAGQTARQRNTVFTVAAPAAELQLYRTKSEPCAFSKTYRDFPRVSTGLSN